MKNFEIVRKDLPVIQINFEEVKETLSQKLTEYKGLVVTEETIPVCKKILADLNKEAKQIDTFRKEIKKEMSKPIKEFEDKCKELVTLYDNVKIPIKENLAFYEDKRKQERQNLINELIKEYRAEFNVPDSWDLSLNSSYLNKTVSQKAIRDTIKMKCLEYENLVEKKQRDYQLIINHLDSTNQAFGLSHPLEIEDINLYELPDGNYNIDAIIQEITRMAKIAKKAESAPDVPGPAIEETQTEDIPFETEDIPFETEDIPFEKTVYSKTLEITATEDEWNKIKSFLVLNYIDFEFVK